MASFFYSMPWFYQFQPSTLQRPLLRMCSLHRFDHSLSIAFVSNYKPIQPFDSRSLIPIAFLFITMALSFDVAISILSFLFFSLHLSARFFTPSMIMPKRRISIVIALTRGYSNDVIGQTCTATFKPVLDRANFALVTISPERNTCATFDLSLLLTESSI